MILLYSTISLLKSISGIFAIPSSSFNSFYPCCPCWTFASVLGCFGTGRLTVAFPLLFTSPRTSPCLGHSPSVCLACCWLCSSFACCWLCSARFFSSFLPLSTFSAALRAHRRFDVLLAVLVPVLLLYNIFTTGSSAVVQSRILTTCSLAVAPSVSLSHHWLLGCGSVSNPLQRHFVVGYIFLDASPAPPIHTTTRHCALRDRRLAAGARAPWSCSLHQRVLLTMKTDSSSGSFGRFVAAAVRRWFPTPPRHHCVILWAVSTLITKAYFAASLATAWSVGSFGTGGVSSILVFLCRLVSFSGLLIVTRYFPSRELMTLSLFCYRHLLRKVFHTAVGCDCASCS